MNLDFFTATENYQDRSLEVTALRVMQRAAPECHPGCSSRERPLCISSGKQNILRRAENAFAFKGTRWRLNKEEKRGQSPKLLVYNRFRRKVCGSLIKPGDHAAECTHTHACTRGRQAGDCVQTARRKYWQCVSGGGDGGGENERE
jgi:hypothetical protein